MSSSKEEATGADVQMLSIEDAEARAWHAVDNLEEYANQFDNTPGWIDEARRIYFASRVMSLLADRYGIKPPKK